LVLLSRTTCCCLVPGMDQQHHTVICSCPASMNGMSNRYSLCTTVTTRRHTTVLYLFTGHRPVGGALMVVTLCHNWFLQVLCCYLILCCTALAPPNSACITERKLPYRCHLSTTAGDQTMSNLAWIKSSSCQSEIWLRIMCFLVAGAPWAEACQAV
jgi:hypothetical protein